MFLFVYNITCHCVHTHIYVPMTFYSNNAQSKRSGSHFTRECTLSNTYLKDVDKLNDVRMTLAESKKLDLIGTINTARNYFDGIFLPCRSMHTTPANGKTTISKYCVMQINIILAKKGRVLEKLKIRSIDLYFYLISPKKKRKIISNQ